MIRLKTRIAENAHLRYRLNFQNLLTVWAMGLLAVSGLPDLTVYVNQLLAHWPGSHQPLAHRPGSHQPLAHRPGGHRPGGNWGKAGPGATGAVHRAAPIWDGLIMPAKGSHKSGPNLGRLVSWINLVKCPNRGSPEM